MLQLNLLRSFVIHTIIVNERRNIKTNFTIFTKLFRWVSTKGVPMLKVFRCHAYHTEPMNENRVIPMSKQTQTKILTKFMNKPPQKQR